MRSGSPLRGDTGLAAEARALHEAGAAADRIARQLLPALGELGDADVGSLDGWVVDWLLQFAPGCRSATPADTCWSAIWPERWATWRVTTKSKRSSARPSRR